MQNADYSSINSNRIEDHKIGIIDKNPNSTCLFVKNLALNNTINYSVSFEKGPLLVKTGFFADLVTILNSQTHDNIEIIK